MCAVKNFHAGQFSGPTRGLKITFFPPGSPTGRSGLNSSKQKASICCNKNFHVGQFLCDICWLEQPQEFKPI